MITKKKLKEMYLWLRATVRYTLNYCKYAKLRSIDVVNDVDTIEYIIQHRCSVSRFGDGELSHAWQYITGENFVGDRTFQKYDSVMGAKLASLLRQKNYDNNRHIVCVPYVFYRNGGKGYRLKAQAFIRGFVNQYHELLYSTINTKRKYFDTNVTRFYLSHTDRKQARRNIEHMQKIWEGRNICFVEGAQTRLGYGNDLFAKAASITRILGPVEGAFSKYEEILEVAKQQPKDTLFLLALGMTATLLAYDLSQAGFQAIDLGHIDIEYEWMLMGATEKVAIPYKYMNEVEDGRAPEKVEEQEYLSQIVNRIN